VAVVHDRRGIPHAGIAYRPKDSRSIGQIVDGLVLIREALEPEDMTNHEEYICAESGSLPVWLMCPDW
jgi:hypothetical protein